ncbi:MAG: NAD-dependent epimerase/dehydratase family protein, partial [Bryobacteraceae bacterium]
DKHSNLVSVKGDIRDSALMERVFDSHRPEGVFHCAAILAHEAESERFLWTSNVDGTQVVAECSKKFGTSNLVFTSSNCLWGKPLGRPVTEDDEPAPVELYGRSKQEGEKILDLYRGDLNVVMLRCPTIIDAGRLGLLSILFEFIQENRKVWTVGGGHNRYQFIYAQDLADAALCGIRYGKSGVFNVGSENVRTIREVYNYVIERAGSSSRVASLPRGLTLAAMKLAYAAKVSPLGPYHYKMIAEDFLFDLTRIKNSLGWKPTLTNEEMLFRAYQYYAANRNEIDRRQNVSAHRKSASMGAIRLLKWIS